jgi:hypothetical protein
MIGEFADADDNGNAIRGEGSRMGHGAVKILMAADCNLKIVGSSVPATEREELFAIIA